MSSPVSYTLVLAQQAQDDIDDILLYTLQTWGDEQEKKYAQLLGNGLRAIQNDPRLGRRRRGIPAGYQLYHVGRHLIAYRVEGQLIYVARVLHDQMDIPRHLN